ncbi:MAG: hypothetical protein US28_C0003G0029 [Candidatus Daviesbacteria bacterium GW2011_GWA1_36_8]|uniref:Uncharacterized protein n=2 Tax=Candidatus Daviesiibacteriota TaxID=1752718 RepID=A0A0G0HXI5_9BACT|nr:MAG: hypothetical protein US19_C0021G0002 [Candidatus Daviesbacteria bacterium GW2011_GWB1_36_5]KKQ16265.1 MAG: hypothetical protein US28_C0003G0029 [Candidatus Daviesbacteria bacterium GW2011_GWA1_36_8]
MAKIVRTCSYFEIRNFIKILSEPVNFRQEEFISCSKIQEARCNLASIIGGMYV